MTTIHLIRHGEVHNPDNILYARLPGRYLTARGHQQAEVVAGAMAQRPIAAVYSSPMPRAVQTADYFAYAHGLTLTTSALINEILTPYQGWTMDHIEAMGWDLYSNLPSGYEDWNDVLARIQTFCTDICTRYPEQEVIAVAHGDIAITAALWAEALPLEVTSRAQISYPGHVSITSLGFESLDARPTRTYTDLLGMH